MDNSEIVCNQVIGAHPEIEVVPRNEAEKQRTLRRVAYYRGRPGGEVHEVAELKRCARPRIIETDDDEKAEDLFREKFARAKDGVL